VVAVSEVHRARDVQRGSCDGGHRSLAARQPAIAQAAEAVPDTTEIGYHIRGNEGMLVARREVEIDFGGGMRKRYEVIAPITR